MDKHNFKNEDIKEFELKYSVQFPQEFINFYLKYDGGHPTRNYMKMSNGFEIYNIKMNSFKSLRGFPIEKNIQILSDVLKPKMIPFADDFIGNFISISLSNEDYGKIFYYDHERDKHLLLATNFEEYINQLEVDPEGEYTPKEDIIII